jgi:hypothetical protein
MSALTDCQRAYLDAIRIHGSAGNWFAEVEYEWAITTRVPVYLEMATAVRVFDALVRKGLAVRNEYGGPVLTEAGEAIVGPMRSRAAVSP